MTQPKLPSNRSKPQIHSLSRSRTTELDFECKDSPKSNSRTLITPSQHIPSKSLPGSTNNISTKPPNIIDKTFQSQLYDKIDISSFKKPTKKSKSKRKPKQRSCKGMKLESCQSIQNISYILGLYHEWLRSRRAINIINKEGMYDRIHNKNSKIRNRTQLLNDFHHIMDEHSTSNLDLETVQKYIQNTATCGRCILRKKGQSSCTIITRHLRDTRKEQNNHSIKAMKYCGYNDKKEIVTQQLLDTIHSFIYHSFDTLRFTVSQQDEINDLCEDNNDYFMNAKAIKKAQQIIAKKKKMVELICKYDPYKANTKFSSSVSNDNNNNNDTFSHNKHSSSLVWDMNMNVNNFKTMLFDDEKTNENNIETIQVKGPGTLMSIYSFGKQFIYHKTNEEFMSTFHLLIKPIYNNLRDELLNNKIYHVSKSDYNDTVEKALVAFSTDKAKKMKRRQDDKHNLDNKNKNNKHRKAEFITVEHILSIIFYTDYSNLCFKFSQTYRRRNEHEKWSHVVQRHSQYYHWGLLLKESVECFGAIAKGNTAKLRKKNTFYHGLNQQLAFTTFIAQFYGPTSFTDELGIAQAFAKDNGMILSLQPHRKWPSLYFDCKWVSMHPAESEKLFIGGQNPLNIFTIITVSYPQSNHRKCLVAMMHISQMIGVESQDVKISFKNEHKTFVKILIENELGINENEELEHRYMMDSFHIFCSNVENVFIDLEHILFKKMETFFKNNDGGLKNDIFVKLFPNARSVRIKGDNMEINLNNNGNGSNVHVPETGVIDVVTEKLMNLVAIYYDENIIEMNSQQKEQEINKLDQWYNNEIIFINTDENILMDNYILHKNDRERYLQELRDKYIDNHTGLGPPNAYCKNAKICGWKYIEECDFVNLTLSQKLHGYFYHNKEYTEYEAKVRSQKYCETRFKKESRKSLLIAPLNRLSFLPNSSPNLPAGNSKHSTVLGANGLPFGLPLAPSIASRQSSIVSVSYQKPPILLKRESSIQYSNQSNDKPECEYHSTMDEIAPTEYDMLQFGDPWEIKMCDAIYNDPKEEILENGFEKLTKSEWNKILRTSMSCVKKKEAKWIGLSLKLVVALKLYTDCDKLQNEFILAYRAEFRQQRIKRQKTFWYWNVLLEESCKRSQDIIIDKLYRGVNQPVKTQSFTGTFWGPVSCTTDFGVANGFVGRDGTILEMYPTYSRRGLKVDWLSAFPYEKEVLYFNTSFQISNIYYKDLTLQQASNILLHKPLNVEVNFMERAILKALQIINIQSHVIDFSDIHNNEFELDNTAGFNELDNTEKIAVLYLLYLQYRSDEWDKFWNKLPENIQFAFAKYRDQFISLAINVTAVKMEKLSMLLQDFFCCNQQEYKFPICGQTINEIENCKLKVEKQFEAYKSLNFGTIVRLFPNAKEISINGDNFDWTLSTFVLFVDKYQLDYQNIALQDIHIKFDIQYPFKDGPPTPHKLSLSNSGTNSATNSSNYNIFSNNTFEDIQASKRLNLHKNKSHKNLYKLQKLGWKFQSASHITRIGFEPLPELPFFMTFMGNSAENKLYYRTKSQILFNTDAFLKMSTSMENLNAFNIEIQRSDFSDDSSQRHSNSRITTPVSNTYLPYCTLNTNDSNYSHYSDDEGGDFPETKSFINDNDNDIPFDIEQIEQIEELQPGYSPSLQPSSLTSSLPSSLPSLPSTNTSLYNNYNSSQRASTYYHLNNSQSIKPNINNNNNVKYRKNTFKPSKFYYFHYLKTKNNNKNIHKHINSTQCQISNNNLVNSPIILNHALTNDNVVFNSPSTSSTSNNTSNTININSCMDISTPTNNLNNACITIIVHHHLHLLFPLVQIQSFHHHHIHLLFPFIPIQLLHHQLHLKHLQLMHHHVITKKSDKLIEHSYSSPNPITFNTTSPTTFTKGITIISPIAPEIMDPLPVNLTNTPTLLPTTSTPTSTSILNITNLINIFSPVDINTNTLNTSNISSSSSNLNITNIEDNINNDNKIITKTPYTTTTTATKSTYTTATTGQDDVAALSDHYTYEKGHDVAGKDDIIGGYDSKL